MALAAIFSVLVWGTSLWAQPVALAHTTSPIDNYLRLNQIQIKGTHNSYHRKPHFLLSAGWNYSRAPLSKQLAVHGIRSVELDLHLSRDGTRLEVYHIAVLDERTTCREFAGCLQELRDWSDSHAEHLPLIVWLEVKDMAGGRRINDLHSIEAAIQRSVGDRLITPDAVKGAYGSLRQAVAHRGWPRLGEVRGKMLFVLLNKKGRHTRTYTRHYTSLDGRLMFAKAAADQLDMPWAALTHLDATRTAAIRSALGKGLLVITTACRAGMRDARCFARRDAALRNGVHIIKDDFPARVPERRYWLAFPQGNVVRCNPVTAPACRHTAPEMAAHR